MLIESQELINRMNKVPDVAILVSSSLAWGRSLMTGILSYTETVDPWNIWVDPRVAPGDFRQLPEDWNGHGVIANVASEELADNLKQSGLPVVNVSDMPVEELDTPCIRTDDREGTRMAADLFLAKGFRHFAFVGSTTKSNSDRFNTLFNRALANHGFTSEAYPVMNHSPNDSEVLTKWLSALPKPVAILTWGVGSGRAVMAACLKAGISVPHDVVVLSGGYDDVLCRACFPTLSGILTPTEQIGFHAAKLLHKMMQGKPVKPELIEIKPTGIKEHVSTDSVAVDDPQLVTAMEYLHEHAYEEIYVTDVLDSVSIGRRVLERRFKQAFGRTMLDEIRRLRINKARRLLIDTDMQMQEIAEACGYETYNYLALVFKRTTGMSPRAYRQEQRAINT